METGEQLTSTDQTLPPAPTGRDTRKRSIIIFTISTVLCAALLALLWVQLLTPAAPTHSPDSTVLGTTTTNDALIGQKAPDFTLNRLNGSGNTKLSLADFKGQPVVLNFWSSTCAPCKDEVPLLESQWQHYKSQGVVFLGIDVEDAQSDGLHFLQQYGMTYTSVIDTNGTTLVSYGITYTPETIFIDRSGKVTGAVRMEITSQQLEAGLQTILQ